MDGMPTDQRRGILKSLLEGLRASLISEVIHESHAGSPYSRATVCRSRDQRRDGSRAVVEQVSEGLLANGPDFGIQCQEVPVVIGVHGLYGSHLIQRRGRKKSIAAMCLKTPAFGRGSVAFGDRHMVAVTNGTKLRR
jgi:hypothetical protein